MNQLSTSNADALAHSASVKRVIVREIADAGGWISFARYMEMALYAPGLGYYSAGAAKLGAGGDFITAPELSALFARATARQIATLLAATDGDILELGAGSGRFAMELLLELERLGCLPRRYAILEVSGDLAARQRALLAEHAPHLSGRLAWLDQLPTSFNGIIFANEVLDALPIHLIACHDGGILERGVAIEAGEFTFRERRLEAGELLVAASRLRLDNGYISEINLAARRLIAGLANALDKGVILLIDYGFGESEYYHPQRDRGTLMCHYRHRAHDDPFHLPGLQDITSHVDFSAIATAAIANGLRLAGYVTQAQFLINCGITELLGAIALDHPAYPALARQLQKLLSPAEMGELYKAIAFTKNWPPGTLIGFSRGDKRRQL